MDKSDGKGRYMVRVDLDLPIINEQPRFSRISNKIHEVEVATDSTSG